MFYKWMGFPVMSTILKSFSELGRFIAWQRVSAELCQGEAPELRSPNEVPSSIDDPNSAAEMEALLDRRKFWLGYSPLKGWVILDRLRRDSGWRRTFTLLRDRTFEWQSAEEFRNEPEGPQSPLNLSRHEL